MMTTLLEGGNVFKDLGQPLTQRIATQDIMPTVKWLEQITGLDFTSEQSPDDSLPSRWLGSTGRKTKADGTFEENSSGDLDLQVDANRVTKSQLIDQLEKWCLGQGIPKQDIIDAGRKKTNGWIRDAGVQVHFRAPIGGDPRRGFVQTDFMFAQKPQWHQFVLSGNTLRNILINSMAKSLGWKLNQNEGIFDRATNKFISDDPDQIAKLLLNPNASRRDLKSVESIMRMLKMDPKREAKIADFRAHMQREGLPFDETLGENEVNFLARLRDRIVNQGMTALVEQPVEQKPNLREARDPRIPYVEDAVFQQGLQGVKDAVHTLRHAAADARKHITIKWDGSPAVIFGRKPETGEFVLTDKAGAVATGYDGLATSPQQIAQIMRQRDSDAAARGNQADRVEKLLPMYQELWPYLEQATPKNFRGYLKGDMLFSSSDPVRREAGLLIFQPNKFGGIVYRIPENSPLGQQILQSKIGLAVHTAMEDPTAAEQPEPRPQRYLKPVPGLMITAATVDNLENLRIDPQLVSELRDMTSGTNAQALKSLLNPQELSSWQLTDIPRLLVEFINSLKGTDYTGATPRAFIEWMTTKTTARKQKNFMEYLGNPKANAQGLSVAFAIWHLLHAVKQDLQHQLDLQQPGQEGWVIAGPRGRYKIVSRTPGGFAARKKASKE